MSIAASNGVLSSLNSILGGDAVKFPVQPTSEIAKLRQQDDANLVAANDQQKNTVPGTPNVNARRGSYVNVVV